MGRSIPGVSVADLAQAGVNTLAYDNNGNATTPNGSTITWNSYNLPRLVSGQMEDHHSTAIRRRFTSRVTPARYAILRA
jgi:hypothetical protein